MDVVEKISYIMCASVFVLVVRAKSGARLFTLSRYSDSRHRISRVLFCRGRYQIGIGVGLEKERPVRQCG